MEESWTYGLLAVAGGAFGIAGAVLDWEFFMNSRKARFWVRLIGRDATRVFYGVLGIIVCLSGLYVTFAPAAATSGSISSAAASAADTGPESTALAQAAVAAESQPTPSIASLPQLVTGEEIDLLQLVVPERDQLFGQWTKQDAALISPGDRPAILELPAKLPESYVLTAIIERLEGKESFTAGLVVGDNAVTAVVDGFAGQISGLNLLDGRLANSNESRSAGGVLGPGQNTLVYHVTPNSIRVECNGKPVFNWTGDTDRLSVAYQWKEGQANRLKIGSWDTRCRISELTLSPAL